jgi:endonuclease/exonuclease/phosphatase family metal-dependent hydrolase
MGDFNADEANPAYRAAIGAGLRSAFRERHPDAQQVGTFTGFNDAVNLASGVIDHILLGRGWRVLDAGLDRRRYGALWPSDHLPVWAILESR